jgi:hypothetical protein
MKNYITVNRQKINLNFEPQTGSANKPFRLSGISLVLNKPAVWIDKQLFHGTIYTFRYIDTNDFFGFEFDPFGNFLNKVK